jgi:hypothetical protein
MFARLSPEERAMRGCTMHDFSKKIVLSQIESPGKSQADVMIELFIRFYGNEFQGRGLEQISNAIRRYHSEQPVGSQKSTSPGPFTVRERPLTAAPTLGTHIKHAQGSPLSCSSAGNLATFVKGSRGDSIPPAVDSRIEKPTSGAESPIITHSPSANTRS